MGTPVPPPSSSSLTCKTCMDTLAHAWFLSSRSHDSERRVKNRGTITTCSLARICKDFRHQLVFLWAWSGALPSTRPSFSAGEISAPGTVCSRLSAHRPSRITAAVFAGFCESFLFLRRYGQPGQFPHTSHLREHSVQRAAPARYGYTTRTTDTA